MATPAKRPTGRRTLLTPETHDRVVTAVRAGNYLDDAARYAGVSPRTVHLWLARGREALRAADDDESLIPESEMLHVRFLQSVERARSDAVIRNLSLIQRAAEDNWQAAAWYLERTNPRKWGRHETVEITGEDGGPVRVEVSARETLAEKFAAAERAMRDVIDVTAREPDEVDEDEVPRLRRAQ